MTAAAFRNHPQSILSRCFVAAHESKTLLQAELVLPAVFFRHFSPIARHMAREEVHRRLSGLFESGQRARCGDELAEVKQRFVVLSFAFLNTP